MNGLPPANLVLGERTSAAASVRGAPLSLSVAVESGTATSFNWEFGDGTTATSTTPSISHTYANPGRYQVTVTASNAISSDQITFFQRVHDPLLSNQAQSSMDMVYQQRTDGDRVFIVNPDNDSVTAINAVTGALIGEIPVGDEPRSIALGNGGQAYVVNKNADSISIFNTTSLTISGTRSLPRASRPHGIVLDRSTQVAYVALEASGQILKIDTPSGQISHCLLPVKVPAHQGRTVVTC